MKSESELRSKIRKIAIHNPNPTGKSMPVRHGFVRTLGNLPLSILLLSISLVFAAYLAITAPGVWAQSDCPTRVAGRFGSKDVWRLTNDILILAKDDSKTIIGRIISQDENGVIFDPNPKSAFYDPKAKHWPFSEIQVLIASNGGTVYGVVPIKFRKTRFWELTITLTDSLNEESYRISVRADRPIDYCLPPGNYMVTEVLWKDELGNTMQGSKASRHRFQVKANSVNDFGDLFLESYFIQDGTQIRQVRKRIVKLQTQDGTEYVYEFQETDAKRKLETWYTYWGFGYPLVSYSRVARLHFNIPTNASNFEHTILSLDFFGTYFPKGERTLLGFVVNGFTYEYVRNSVKNGVRGITYAFSFMHFLNSRIGQGLFMRGDLGPAKFGGDAILTFRDSNWGIGFSVGGGFALPISKGTSLLLNVSYDARIIANGDHHGLEFSIGGLF